MPLHQKPAIVTFFDSPSEQSDATTVNAVSIDINPQTIITIFGVRLVLFHSS